MIDRKLNRLATGALASLAAGLIMALVAMIRSATLGLGFWLPAQSIAATFLGVEALIGGPGVVALGLVVHLAASVLAGLIFGALISLKSQPGVIVGLGLAYGIFIWAAMTFLVLPLVNEVMLERVLVAPVWWLVQHVIFGLVLGAVVVQLSAHQKRERDPEDHALRSIASVD